MAVTIVYQPTGPGGQTPSYEYDSGPTQLASHVINHNLGFRPNVSAFDRDTEQEIVGRPIHHSVNQIEIVFNSPRAIKARLS